MQLMPVLAPIHREYGTERVNVATYQSVSRRRPQRAMEELGMLNCRALSFQDIEPKSFRCRSPSI